MTQATPDERQQHLNMAADLLWAVWTQIDAEYKARYRMDIWTQFETSIAAVARMTTNLDQFLSRLCGKFAVAVPGQSEGDRAHLDQLLAGRFANPDSILSVIREYPQVCVLKVRIYNDERKADYAANK